MAFDLSNLPFLQKIGREVNRRLLDVQSASHNCHLSQASVERVVQPTITQDGQRAPGLRFGVPRTMALLAALTLFVQNTCGFRHQDFLSHVADLLGSPYSTHQLTYDLRRLRLICLIRLYFALYRSLKPGHLKWHLSSRPLCIPIGKKVPCDRFK